MLTVPGSGVGNGGGGGQQEALACDQKPLCGKGQKGVEATVTGQRVEHQAKSCRKRKL